MENYSIFKFITKLKENVFSIISIRAEWCTVRDGAKRSEQEGGTPKIGAYTIPKSQNRSPKLKSKKKKRFHSAKIGRKTLNFFGCHRFLFEAGFPTFLGLL
jgi:hypothetical protein